MKILQVSTADIGGGAEKIAYNLFQEYQRQGHTSWLAVGNKYSSTDSIYVIPPPVSKAPWGMIWYYFYQKSKEQKRNLLSYFFKFVDMGMGGIEKYATLLGWEDFYFPGSLKLLSLSPELPEIVHMHNLHGGYFDLRFLKSVSNQLPVILTMHDEWLLTGHCAASMNCPRWMNGCGKCPDLKIYQPIYRDATAFNWNRKRKIYNQSKLYVATPSKWLFDRVQESMLRPYEAKIINNGVDVRLFTPGSSSKARDALHLPQDAKIILVVANFLKQNPFKDYLTIERAIAQLGAESNQESIILVTLGGQKDKEMLGSIPVYHFPFECDENLVVKYYQAADVYIHSTRTDNFPTTILEAFACGKPVIATAIGGILEQIKEGENGYLVPLENSVFLAERIKGLVKNNIFREEMGSRARKTAEAHYDLQVQVKAYLDWYTEILEIRKS